MDTKSYHIRVPKRWARIALIVGVTALIAAPLTAVATHTFNDVPDTHTFHGDIEWLEASGVTKGCNPPANTLYCPDDDVTRGQMSAFMRRLAQYMGAEDGTPAQADNAATADNAVTLEGQSAASYTNPVVSVQTDNTNLPIATVVELAELSITTPGDGGLSISGMLRPESAVNAQATFWLQLNNETCTFDVANFFSITASRIGNEGTFDTSAPIMGVVETPAGDHTVTLCARTFSGATLAVESTLIAMYSTDVSKSGSITAASDLGEEGVPTE